MFFWSSFLFFPILISVFIKNFRRYISFYFGFLFFLFCFFIFYTSSVFEDGGYFDSDVYVFNFHPGLVMYYETQDLTCDTESCGVNIKPVLLPASFSLCSLTQRKDNNVDIFEVRSRFSVCKIYVDGYKKQYGMNIKYGPDTLFGFIVYTFIVFLAFIFSILIWFSKGEG
jgi:hypothetical protein